MEIKDLQNVKAPFDVLSIKDGSRHTIKGFAQNDPLGVGGGFFPDIPVVYFEGGGWILVSDLLRHYEIAPNKACTGRKASVRRVKSKSVVALRQ